MNLVIRAAQFAEKAHRGQWRKYTGAAYITHPIRVAGRVATHKLATEELVAAAFLHDVVEDCGIHQLIDKDWVFWGTITDYVLCLTNQKRAGLSRDEQKAMDREHLGKLVPALKIVKLIDRIDNLNEIGDDYSFALQYAKESLLLLDVLKGVDHKLEQELEDICRKLITNHTGRE